MDAGRVDDAAFLDVLIRIRFMADMALLPPADIETLFQQPEFADAFARIRKFADMELVRDPARFDTLIDRVNRADLTVSEGYNPGWTISEASKPELYNELIEGMRVDTLAMERYVAMLVRDDAYYAAYLDRQAMLAAVRGTQEALPDRYGEKTRIIWARIRVLGDPPEETAVAWRKVYAPNEDAPFTVLYRGFNGLQQGGAKLIRSEAELRQSWIKDALSADELASVIANIDFETEVLGVYVVGQMPNATENFFVTEFGPDEAFGGYSISVRVGVAGGNCDFTESLSSPFILVKAPMGDDGDINATSRSNYPDQCAPVMTGEPSVPDGAFQRIPNERPQ